jgi:hypothetical protein
MLLNEQEIIQFLGMSELHLSGVDEIYLVGRIEEGKGYQYIKKNNKD